MADMSETLLHWKKSYDQQQNIFSSFHKRMKIIVNLQKRISFEDEAFRKKTRKKHHFRENGLGLRLVVQRQIKARHREVSMSMPQPSRLAVFAFNMFKTVMAGTSKPQACTHGTKMENFPKQTKTVLPFISLSKRLQDKTVRFFFSSISFWAPKQHILD